LYAFNSLFREVDIIYLYHISIIYITHIIFLSNLRKLKNKYIFFINP
jgi:hypothetical protein